LHNYRSEIKELAFVVNRLSRIELSEIFPCLSLQNYRVVKTRQ